MHDSVWIEDLTMLEVRDLIKVGKVLGIHEKLEGYHDDYYYISAIIATVSTDAIRMPERIKAMAAAKQ